MTNISSISPKTQEMMDGEIERRANLPTTRLNSMVAFAHETIAALDENEENIRAGLVVLTQRLEDQLAERTRIFTADIAELRKRIDEITAERSKAIADAETRIAESRTDVEAQLAAIARMRDAQRTVVATLAKDVSPIEAMSAVADAAFDPAPARKRK